MFGRMRERTSFANTVSLLALFVALGGTSYAAVKLPRNSVGASQIKAGGVGSSEVKNGALRQADFRAGELPAGAKGDKGDRGEKGDKGDAGQDGTAGAPGAPGSAAAFARVGSTGSLDAGVPSQNEGVVQANVQHDGGAATATTTGPGVYCFGGLPFTPRSAMVAADSAGAVGTTNMIASVAVQRGANLNQCNGGHQQVRVSLLAVNDSAPPALVNHGFYIWFEE